MTVVSVQWFGSEALELTYKTTAGKVANELLYRHDEPRIEVVEHGRPWSFDGDGTLFRLVRWYHALTVKATFLAYNLLHLIRRFYMRSEKARRSIEWIIMRLIKAGARIVYHARYRYQPAHSTGHIYRAEIFRKTQSGSGGVCKR